VLEQRAAVTESEYPTGNVRPAELAGVMRLAALGPSVFAGLLGLVCLLGVGAGYVLWGRQVARLNAEVVRLNAALWEQTKQAIVERTEVEAKFKEAMMPRTERAAESPAGMSQAELASGTSPRRGAAPGRVARGDRAASTDRPGPIGRPENKRPAGEPPLGLAERSREAPLERASRAVAEGDRPASSTRPAGPRRSDVTRSDRKGHEAGPRR
jgi:hypothetical protein